MHTVIETPVFQRLWPRYWAEDEYERFVVYIAGHPDAGSVIPGAKGLRKVRWGQGRSGKSGGVRVVYFVRTARGEIVLLSLYAKSDLANLSFIQLKEIRRVLGE